MQFNKNLSVLSETVHVDMQTLKQINKS